MTAIKNEICMMKWQSKIYAKKDIELGVKCTMEHVKFSLRRYNALYLAESQLWYTTLYRRRKNNSQPPPWEPQILIKMENISKRKLSAGCRSSSIGVATGYGLAARIRFPARARNISLLSNVHIDSGNYPVSYPMSTGGSSPEVKQPKREANHSPSYTAEAKNDQEW